MSKRELIAQLRSAVRAAQVAVAARDQAIGELLGVNATDHRCLDLLDQRGPMTASTLAAALGLTRSATTTVIDRLQALGYVRRAPSAQDRRQVLVELTPLLVVDGDTVTSDAAGLAGAKVTAEILAQTKGPKIRILKFKNKTGYRKRQGHRQRYTQVKVTGIES